MRLIDADKLINKIKRLDLEPTISGECAYLCFDIEALVNDASEIITYYFDVNSGIKYKTYPSEEVSNAD